MLQASDFASNPLLDSAVIDSSHGSEVRIAPHETVEFVRAGVVHGIRLGMDGVALAERVHAEKPHVEIIVTSGDQKLEDRDLPDDGTFLPKPYQPDQLVRLVKEKLG